jgi:hypothetical protein
MSLTDIEKEKDEGPFTIPGIFDYVSPIISLEINVCIGENNLHLKVELQTQ